MQSKSRPLDDLANLMTNAVGAVKGVGDEVKAMSRSQAERLIADMDLVSRDEFEVLKAQLQKSQAEVTALQKELKAIKSLIKKTLDINRDYGDVFIFNYDKNARGISSPIGSIHFSDEQISLFPKSLKSLKYTPPENGKKLGRRSNIIGTIYSWMIKF